MSHAEAAHGPDADHVPHVLPLNVYLATWGTLMVLTVITVAASYVDFGNMNLWIALVIATMKASVVACLFMHLWFDHKIHALIFVTSLVFLTIFIGFTMFDTETRGRADAIEEQRVADLAAPFQGTTRDARNRKKYVEPPASAIPVPGEPFGPPSASAAPPAAGGASAAAPAPSGSAAASCDHDGKKLKEGEMAPAADGCNFCTCTKEGTMACTEKACADKKDEKKDEKKKDAPKP